jgi:hypothetical protein
VSFFVEIAHIKMLFLNTQQEKPQELDAIFEYTREYLYQKMNHPWRLIFLTKSVKTSNKKV